MQVIPVEIAKDLWLLSHQMPSLEASILPRTAHAEKLHD